MHSREQAYFCFLFLNIVTTLSMIPQQISGMPKNIPKKPLAISVPAINMAPATISDPAKPESFISSLRSSIF